MNTHELVLLSPYRYPAQYAMTMSDEDMASWLNGYTALWHPALLWQAKGPPRCETTYDHETPKAGFIYALPESPPAYLPDDWETRVKAVGALVFKATPDRAVTLANLKAALSISEPDAQARDDGEHPSQSEPDAQARDGDENPSKSEPDAQARDDGENPSKSEPDALAKTDDEHPSLARRAQSLLDLSPDDLGPFFGLAWGHLLLAALAEAMEHENLLQVEAFWTDVQQAIRSRADASGSSGECLKAAAARLLAAREVLYPVAIHLLDVSFLDESTMAFGWPAGFDFGIPSNFIAATATLEQLAQHAPKRFAQIQNAVQTDVAEVCGGSYLEREDPLLPIDSQLWNLRYGLDRAKELLGVDIRVFARKRFGYHPHLPLFLSSNGVVKAMFLTFDENAGLPNFANCVVSWPSPDGKQIDAFTRQPKYADSVETFFNLGQTWFKTTREDSAATVFLLHRDKPTAVWHRDLIELARLGPVFGKWTTLSRYLGEVQAGEYPSIMTADDFHFDFLSERIAAGSDEPVSAFARHQRTRRRIDACWTYAALHRSLAGVRDALAIDGPLRAVENQAETTLQTPAELDTLEKQIAAALADRLQARAEPNRPGYMILNPCGFARRAALELDGGAHPLPIGGIVKACELTAGKLRAVIEIPALGFAWLPREGPPGTPPMTTKLRMGDPQSNTIRNDFFEVEVDAHTGGLKAVRDHKMRISRLGQMLVFNPGSRMAAKEIKVTATGPALAEIVSAGFLLGEQDQILAGYRQRLRLWMGRPLLEMRTEITPQQAPAGYGWHAYFGSRFAWRDEKAMLVRGFNGVGYITNHPRPQTPDYLDIRTPPTSTTIFTGGLPFHQKQGARMVDVILVPEGEKTTVFEMGIAFDREVPTQTAWGYTSPLAIVPTTKGPPHIGASGWLFHIDASNLLLTRMTPGPGDAITARFLECANYSGLAEFRCVRDPQRATVLNARGDFLLEANRSGDVVHLEVTPNDLVHVQVEFSTPSEPEA